MSEDRYRVGDLVYENKTGLPITVTTTSAHSFTWTVTDHGKTSRWRRWLLAKKPRKPYGK